MLPRLVLRLVPVTAVIVLAMVSVAASAATCAKTNVDGYLYLSTDALAECSGHVVMDAAEYSQVPTLQAIFAMPEIEKAGAIWLAGFSLPMITYLAAWGFGVVINFFNSDKERY